MIGLVYALLFLPCCAALAGTVLYLTHRDDELDNDTLVRHFIVLLIAVALVGWGVCRTKPVRVLIDPEFALQTALEANPVYAAMQQGGKEDLAVLHRFLVGPLSKGRSVNDALVEARPLLTRLAEEHLDFAKPQIRVGWAQASAAALHEARQHGGRTCYALVAGKTEPGEPAPGPFSAQNTAAFQRAVTALYEERSRPVDPKTALAAPSVEREELNAVRTALRDKIVARFGPEVATHVRKQAYGPAPEALFDAICEARLYQLDAILDHPTPLASELLRDIW